MVPTASRGRVTQDGAPALSWPSCIFCATHDPKPFLQPGGIAIVTCRQCGHCYSTFPREEAYAQYFGEKIHSADYAAHQAFWADAHRRVHRRVLAQMGSSGLRILDVGCGLGYFVKEAMLSGADAHGCEISKSAVHYAREVLGLSTILPGRVEELPYQPNSFDLITLWDVVEHLTNPLPMLTAVHRLMSPGGTLFIQTPNVRFHKISALLKHRLGNSDPSLMEPCDHMNNFSRTSLSRLLSLAGYSRVRFAVLPAVESLGLNQSPMLVAMKRSYVLMSQGVFFLTWGRVVVSNTLHAFASK